MHADTTADQSECTDLDLFLHGPGSRAARLINSAAKPVTFVVRIHNRKAYHHRMGGERLAAPAVLANRQQTSSVATRDGVRAQGSSPANEAEPPPQ